MVPEEGCFSDRVIALAIGWSIIKELGLEGSPVSNSRFGQSINKSSTVSQAQWEGPRYGVRKTT